MVSLPAFSTDSPFTVTVESVRNSDWWQLEMYGPPVYVADALAEDEEIAFNAGSHTQLIRLRYQDFAELVQPTVLEFTAGAR